MTQSIGIIVATYNKPAFLRAALRQLERQSRLPDQVIVADDGSGDETQQVCIEFEKRLNGFLHVRHDDAGFRKCEIQNKAIQRCICDYVIFLDDDCLCPPSFIENHEKASAPGYFTVGSTVDLKAELTQSILTGLSAFSRFLELGSLEKLRNVQTGLRGGWLKLFFRELMAGKSIAPLMDRLYPGRGVFRGGNSGAWRDDLVSVNGFNNDLRYGHEDREIGERLRNAGLKARQVRFSAANFHLDHPRPYADRELIEQQRAVYREVRKEGRVVCENGLAQVG